MFKADWEKASSTHQLSLRIVDQMIALAYPNQQIINCELIAGGCANLNYKILVKNEKHPFILRIYLRNQSAAYCEQRLAKLLKSTLLIPETYYIGKLDEFVFALTEFMPGIPLRDLLLSNAPHDPYAIMYDVGAVLAKISAHKFPLAGFFDNNFNLKADDTARSIKEFSLKCLDHPQVIRYLKPKTRVSIQRHLEQLLDYVSEDNSLVHADFDPANILVQKIDNKWQVSAVLDWEFAYAGSFMDDVATMLRYAHKMPSDFQQGFFRGLTDNGIKLPKNFQAIIRQYNLAALLDGMTRHPLHQRPKIYKDIVELIDHILLELNCSSVF